MAAFDWIPVGTEVKKMYASYSTCEKFIQDTLLQVNPQERHFYELVLQGRRCKPFIDGMERAARYAEKRDPSFGG